MDLPTIQIGTRVTLHDSEDDHVYTLTMVAPLPTRQAGEVLALTLAPEKLGLPPDTISSASPVGKAMLGRTAGERVRVPLPSEADGDGRATVLAGFTILQVIAPDATGADNGATRSENTSTDGPGQDETPRTYIPISPSDLCARILAYANAAPKGPVGADRRRRQHAALQFLAPRVSEDVSTASPNEAAPRELAPLTRPRTRDAAA